MYTWLGLHWDDQNFEILSFIPFSKFSCQWNELYRETSCVRSRLARAKRRAVRHRALHLRRQQAGTGALLYSWNWSNYSAALVKLNCFSSSIFPSSVREVGGRAGEHSSVFYSCVFIRECFFMHCIHVFLRCFSLCVQLIFTSLYLFTSVWSLLQYDNWLNDSGFCEVQLLNEVVHFFFVWFLSDTGAQVTQLGDVTTLFPWMLYTQLLTPFFHFFQSSTSFSSAPVFGEIAYWESHCQHSVAVVQFCSSD